MKTLIMATERNTYVDQSHPHHLFNIWTIKKEPWANLSFTPAKVSYFCSNNASLYSCMDENVDSFYNIESKTKVTTDNYINYRKANQRSEEETSI
jgi:hypothetical protein